MIDFSKFGWLDGNVICPYCGGHHCVGRKDGRFGCKAEYRWNTRKLSQSERFIQMFEKAVGFVRRWNEIKVGLMAA